MARFGENAGEDCARDGRCVHEVESAAQVFKNTRLGVRALSCPWRAHRGQPLVIASCWKPFIRSTIALLTIHHHSAQADPLEN